MLLAIKRAEPEAGLNYLTKLTVCGSNPIAFEGEYKAHSEMLVKNATSEYMEERKVRRNRLRNSAWDLFKILVYSCARKVEDLKTGAAESKQARLQEVFINQFYEELLWNSSNDFKEDQGNFASLQLRKVSVGQLWLKKDIQVTSSGINPVQLWLNKFRDDVANAEKYDPEPEGEENSVSNHIN